MDCNSISGTSPESSIHLVDIAEENAPACIEKSLFSIHPSRKLTGQASVLLQPDQSHLRDLHSSF
jgi:hypothetical protein